MVISTEKRDLTNNQSCQAIISMQKECNKTVHVGLDGWYMFVMYRHVFLIK